MEKEIFVPYEPLKDWDDENYKAYFVRSSKRFSSTIEKWECFDTYDEAYNQLIIPNSEMDRSIYGVRNHWTTNENQEDLLGYIDFEEKDEGKIE